MSGDRESRAEATILHVDLDAFYASVEQLDDPTLRGRPVVVGGLGPRGVVAAASYEARRFGVHSAMPMARARRACPDAAFIAPRFDAYGDASTSVMTVMRSYTPLVEPLSLDEAFLDVAGSLKLFGDPVTIGRRIKDDIASLGLPCTVGIAANKFLAKLASQKAKPDGLLLVPADRIEEFLHPLSVTALWGVGERTGEALRRLGLKTVADVAAMPRRTLQRALGDSLGAHLSDLAGGIDDRVVTPHEPAKSVGSEETFSHDLDAAPDILREILRLSERTASRLRGADLCGRTVTLKVRFSNFKTITRSKTLEEEVDNGPEIYDAARALYLKLDPDRPRIRLLGVGVSGLVAGPPRRQMSLLSGSGRPGWTEATEAIDSIRERFGDNAVGPAALLDGDER